MEREKVRGEEELASLVSKESVSMQQVIAFSDKHEKLGFRVWFEPYEDAEEKDATKIMGRYIATELLTDVHEETTGFITYSVLKGVRTATNDPNASDTVGGDGSIKAKDWQCYKGSGWWNKTSSVTSWKWST